MMGGNAAVPSGKRPSLLTFAAILMFVIGGFHILMSISEFANSAWLATRSFGWFGASLTGWAIVDLIFAIVVLCSAGLILTGQTIGGILGLIIAAFIAIRWLFYIPATPVLAVVIIAIALLAVYGLAAEWDWFTPLSDKS